jgi:hypothetical protein
MADNTTIFHYELEQKSGSLTIVKIMYFVVIFFVRNDPKGPVKEQLPLLTQYSRAVNKSSQNIDYSFFATICLSDQGGDIDTKFKRQIS